MSDTTVQECKKCRIETDCINNICQECALKDQQVPIKKFTEECRKHICVSQIEGFVPYSVAKRLVYLLCDRLDYLDKILAHEIDMNAQGRAKIDIEFWTAYGALKQTLQVLNEAMKQCAKLEKK